MKKRIIVARYDDHVNSIAFSSWDEARSFVVSRIDMEKCLFHPFDKVNWVKLEYFEIVSHRNDAYKLKPHTWELNEVEVVSAASK